MVRPRNKVKEKIDFILYPNLKFTVLFVHISTAVDYLNALNSILVFMHYRLTKHPEIENEKDKNKHQHRYIRRFIFTGHPP
ncbi:hypothetical protein MNV_1250021 [Candidatus Methanoperedens nitroreducens]|uniref:Uncharacterized protein n=1 Tax=Candidatus Methanoperedens nitratireducens TaxID=1392998 RepID=A0A284VK51_9EURY|nr:hypothetical protein MNV_1250021 [Candidatus Methanoperedens nitroreducens]